MNDLKLSELVTKSLAGGLSEIEKAELKSRLEKAAPEAQSFAHLSALIQQAVTQGKWDETPGDSSTRDADRSDPPVEEFPPQKSASLDSSSDSNLRLSDVARQRLKNSVQRALKNRPASGSRFDAPPEAGDGDSFSSLRVAELNTAYYSGGNGSDGITAPQRSLRRSSSIGEGPEEGDENRQAVARFTLVRKIGEGGLGTVWLARDEKLKRNVALKEMKPAAAENPKLVKRFQREAEITGHLEHPNVVPLYMSGINPETRLPFYAMRFLGKQTLADAICEFHAQRLASREDPLSFHRLLNIFSDICQAIAYAHSRGVIHRDLKPENVALDNFGQVLVLDWGLAKLDTDGELATRLALSGSHEDSAVAQTIDGDVVGTPLYMSPEQAAGQMDRLDERTDIYGLGAILFAILTGDAPHERSHKTEGGNLKVADFLASIAEKESPTPRAVNPHVPRELEEICLRAMAKERFARHSSATELAREVEAWIAGKHERQERYESMRMTGRDLKSRLCVQLRQLMATAQFMVELPPIQGMLGHILENSKPSDDLAAWRERLSSILLALAKTKSNITGLSYAQIADDRINELMRVERSLQDISNIRAVPQSRLRRGAANTFHKIVMQQFPGECSLDYDCATAGQIRLVCGVPVFDEKTEEPFGLILVESEIGNMIRPELNMTGTGENVFVVDDRGAILFTTKPVADIAVGQVHARDVIDRWDEIDQASASDDYTESDREFYATKLSFPQNNNSLRIILQVAN